MSASKYVRLFGVGLAFSFIAASCSGSGDDTATRSDSDSEASTAPSAGDDSSDDASADGDAAIGPVDGLITVGAGLGLGLFGIDRTSGEAVEFASEASIGFLDRQTDLVLRDGAAFTLGFTQREGQSFSNDVSVVKIDLETTEVLKLVDLGFDRETDDSETSISYSFEAVLADSVVVRSGEFGGDDTYRVYDSTTGAELSSFATPAYEKDHDTGSCSGTVSRLAGLSDGRLVGIALGSVAIIDPATGEVELMRDCDVPSPELSDFVSIADFGDYAVFNSGGVPTDEDIDRFLGTELEVSSGFVEGDGDLWWLNVSSRSSNDVRVIVGGVVQFDLATQSVEAVYGLGEFIGEYTECPDADGVCNLQTVEQAQLRFIDGRLVMAEIDENGRVLVLDPSNGEISATEIVAGDGVDFTRVDLLSGDPAGVWLEVSRMTITQDDDSGRTAFGPRYIEQFDPITGTVGLSLPVEDVFGF
ncbi:MAG: hypothetical protein GXP35_11265 [Actinobacteria bacterium]|nr:hypothetical protein [Actinomycetota bacterium]